MHAFCIMCARTKERKEGKMGEKRLNREHWKGCIVFAMIGIALLMLLGLGTREKPVFLSYTARKFKHPIPGWRMEKNGCFLWGST